MGKLKRRRKRIIKRYQYRYLCFDIVIEFLIIARVYDAKFRLPLFIFGAFKKVG